MEQQLISQDTERGLSSFDVELPATGIGCGRPGNSRNQPSTDTAGLHCVAEPKDTASQSFDIVAIHGVNGHWEKSWTDGKTGFFWLRDSLPQQFPEARIYSYSPRSTIDNVSETLLFDLLDDRSIRGRSELPIILLGLSLGGVKGLHSKIAGFVFMGTQQNGTMNDTVTKLLSTARIFTLSRQTKIWDDVRVLCEQIPTVNSDFKLLKGERLPLACFYETEPVSLGGIIVARPHAIIESDGLGFNENRQIDRSHNNLAKFESPDDPNLRRVLGTMSRLVQHVFSPYDGLVRQTLPTPEPETLPLDTASISPPQTSVHVEPATAKLRILSLDGGGVRGLFTVIVLEALMEEIRILTKQEDEVKPCDFFDLIGGTSTGGLLALMLSRLRIDLISCKKQYRELSKIVFQKQGWSYPFKSQVDAWFGRAWYPAEPLEASIKALIAERIRILEKKELRGNGQPAEEAPLRSEHISKARCFVCAIRGGERGCARLRSYVSKSGEGDRICAIWQACRATSAAQLYFPPTKIGDETYWDGGSESNNPVQETYEEAFLEYGDDPPLAGIVSIGTGMPAHKDPGTKARAAVDSFIARATDTESIHLRFKKQHPQLSNIYFRLQGPLELGAIDLADWTKLDTIERMAHEYLESNEGLLAIEQCARQLVQ